MRVKALAAAVILGVSSITIPAANAVASIPPPTSLPLTGQPQSFTLPDGSTVEVGPDGMGVHTSKDGKHSFRFSAIGPQASSLYGDKPGPDRDTLIKQFSVEQHGTASPGTVIVALSSASVDGAAVVSPKGHSLRAAHTTDTRVNATLQAVGAKTAESLLGAVPAERVGAISSGAAKRLGSGAVDLSRVYVMDVTGSSADEAAEKLRATPGVAYAEPDFYMSTMDTNPVKLPAWVNTSAKRASAATGTGSASKAAPAPKATSAGVSAGSDPALPTNFAFQSSLQAYLNASGVNLPGAYADIVKRFGQIPGQGENITNVSLGDLTDQAMGDAGDPFVQFFGPTTVVENGQRFLDYPALPKIPTYTVDLNGRVDPLGSVEGVDPNLGEVLLDFSMMSPLPHDRQRPGAQGDGVFDLLGIAPGANYRLVEPAQPTFANILTAMAAAAAQTPKPDVITVSLGFGTDVQGFAGRYLEDDPVIRSVVAGLVQNDGIVMTISANDGTRLFTPAAVGPDGGSTPTDLPNGQQAPTSVADDALSTTPSLVPDSGAIAVGGTTLDDTVAAPPLNGGPLAHTATFAETRLDGDTSFSSGFGTRVNVSAPSDNIIALNHTCCDANSATLVLSGGTSASAPMTAAAAADLLQVARMTGRTLRPADVRDLLERTGRDVPTQPQIDRNLHVGPQIDITRAVETLLGAGSGSGGDNATGSGSGTSIVRLSVSQREIVGNGGNSFVELADPNNIDLAGPVDFIGDETGDNLLSPITIGLDVSGAPPTSGTSYALRIGSKTFTSTTPSIRLLPSELLEAANLPLASATPRTITVTAEVRRDGQSVATATQSLTFSPAAGTHETAPAPRVDPVSRAGSPVTVHYDFSNIPATSPNGNLLVDNPQLIVSSIDHWSPFTAPLYRVQYSVPLTATTGTVTIPAQVFAAGTGIYGVAIEQSSGVVGGVAPFRVGTDGPATRPAAPTIAAGGADFGHAATALRTASTFQVRWDATTVPGARGAMLEISAPGPSLFGLFNNFTDQFGSARDNNGTDTGSRYFAALPAVSGTATFDARALGLPSSLHYSVRVFAAAGGHPIGQASPSSSLQYDDGVAPGDATVDSFDINPGGTATVATSTFDAQGALTSSALSTYTPSTATYGPAFAQDNTGEGFYVLYGSDPGAHRLLAAEYPWLDTTQHLLAFDSSTRRQVANRKVDASSDYSIFGARVDQQRHRLAIVAQRGGDFAPVVVPMATTNGHVGTPVQVGAPSFVPHNLIDIDQSTGDVDVTGSALNDSCVVRASKFTTVNLDTASVSPERTVDSCLTGMVADQAGHAEIVTGPLFSFPSLFPEAGLQEVTERGDAVSDRRFLGGRSPIFPTVDPVHNLLVVGFLTTENYFEDNNATSEVGTYDLKTGAQVSLTQGFGLVGTAFFSPIRAVGVVASERGIQLDPSTRTGYVFGASGTEIQQFPY